MKTSILYILFNHLILVLGQTILKSKIFFFFNHFLWTFIWTHCDTKELNPFLVFNFRYLQVRSQNWRIVWTHKLNQLYQFLYPLHLMLPPLHFTVNIVFYYNSMELWLKHPRLVSLTTYFLRILAIHKFLRCNTWFSWVSLIFVWM